MVNELPASESMSYLAVPTQNRRKFSFPMQLHSGSLLGESSAVSARRRLSNVSDALGRKLSSTIGWKQNIPSQDIITQGKCLCGQYIRSRLKRSGIYNRKLGLQKIRSIIGTPSILVVREVFPALSSIGEELEKMHPRIYSAGVTRQISHHNDLPNAETGAVLLSAIGREIFKNGVNWGKIISLFCVCGALSVDFVRQNHLDYLPKLVDAFAEVVEDELTQFIHENGGWVGLSNKVRPDSQEFTLVEWSIIAFCCIVALVFVVIALKFLYYLMFPVT